jgi:hypothetical protein
LAKKCWATFWVTFFTSSNGRPGGNGERSEKIWDRFYDFKNIFAEKFREKNSGFGPKTKLNYAKF